MLAPIDEESQRMWDVFICHASEDKQAIATPLAHALRENGLTVWYDQFTLTLGDSLREKIDEGLAAAKFGIVILSPSFLGKNWPKRELAGLTAREMSSGKTILPVWRDITREQVEAFSPPLADKIAIHSSSGLEAVVHSVLHAVGRNPLSATASPSVPTTVGLTRVPIDLAGYKRLVDYAYSSSGLNMLTRAKAGEWADRHPELLSETALEAFRDLVEFAYSSSGLNLLTRQQAGTWAEKHRVLLSGERFGRFKELVAYAYSSSGLNLLTRQKAGEWAVEKLRGEVG